MTLLGKIFTVLVFCMSLVFMTLSLMTVASHKNWKLIATNPTATAENPLGLTQQLAETRTRISQMESEKQEVIDKLARERAARRAALGGLQIRLEKLKVDLNEKETQLAAASATLQENLEELDRKQAALTKLTEEVTTAREDIQKAQLERDQQFQKVVELTDRVNQAEGLKVRLEERRTQLIDQVSQQKTVLDRLGKTETSSVEEIAPRVDGRIAAISTRDANRLEISLGKHDGLQVGHTLDVYRSDNYLGRVTVLSIRADTAVAQMDPATRTGQIRVGDLVVSRFTPEYLKHVNQPVSFERAPEAAAP